MAQEVDLGRGGTGKIRSFWVGLGLSVITFGIYGFCWYYFVNDELKDVGIEKGDQNLAQSSPLMSVVAILVGGWVIVPPLLSVYNYGQRIKRAQRLTGLPKGDQINPTVALLLMFPGALLVIPYFLHFWYVTKHQNMALRGAGGLPASGADPARRGVGDAGPR
jgi:Domain of unknown function (DUF4234)